MRTSLLVVAVAVCAATMGCHTPAKKKYNPPVVHLDPYKKSGTRTYTEVEEREGLPPIVRTREDTWNEYRGPLPTGHPGGSLPQGTYPGGTTYPSGPGTPVNPPPTGKTPTELPMPRKTSNTKDEPPLRIFGEPVNPTTGRPISTPKDVIDDEVPQVGQVWVPGARWYDKDGKGYMWDEKGNAVPLDQPKSDVKGPALPKLTPPPTNLPPADDYPRIPAPVPPLPTRPVVPTPTIVPPPFDNRPATPINPALTTSRTK